MRLDRRELPPRRWRTAGGSFAACMPLVLVLLGPGRSTGQVDPMAVAPERTGSSAPPIPQAAASAASTPRPRMPGGGGTLGEFEAKFRVAAPKAPGLGFSGVLVHAWSPLTQSPQTAFKGPRTALYTYVLVGDVGLASGAPVPPSVANARAALAELLAVVQAGQKVQTIQDRDLLLRANQYLVPAPAGHADRVTLSAYDFALAARYLNVMKLALAEHDFAVRMSSTGPFLIALRRPLPEFAIRGKDGRLRFDTNSPVLFIDTSDAHPKSMPAYITAFTEAVRTELPTDTSELRPLRPAFASALLRASEALPFVAEAYAGSRKLLPGN